MRFTHLLLACSLFFAVGCFSSEPVEEQLKAKVSKMLSLQDVKLTEKSDGSYSGSGMHGGSAWHFTLTPEAHYKKKFTLKAPRSNGTYWGTIYVN